MVAKGRPGALASLPAYLFHPQPYTLLSLCRSAGAPDTATLLLFCVGSVSLARGCQIHFDFGLSSGFMLSEKFPPPPFT